jgi:hypothetical protein
MNSRVVEDENLVVVMPLDGDVVATVEVEAGTVEVLVSVVSTGEVVLDREVILADVVVAPVVVADEDWVWEDIEVVDVGVVDVKSDEVDVREVDAAVGVGEVTVSVAEMSVVAESWLVTLEDAFVVAVGVVVSCLRANGSTGLAATLAPRAARAKRRDRHHWPGRFC